MARCRPACSRSPRPPTAFSGCYLSQATSTGSTVFGSYVGLSRPVLQGKSLPTAPAVSGLPRESSFTSRRGLSLLSSSWQALTGFKASAKILRVMCGSGYADKTRRSATPATTGSSVSERTMGFRSARSMRCCPMAAVAYGWEDRPPWFAGTVVVCPRRTRSKPSYRVWPARLMERSGWACSRRDQGWGFNSCATVF